MKKCLILGAILVFAVSTVFAANFAPTQLKLSASPQVQYAFDGKNLSLPVTVSGTSASVYFLLFTKDKAATISKVKNGYLGWHYVNKIDTCMYVSPANNFGKGVNNVIWDGKDENSVQVPPGVYTYYLWGFDNINPKVKATQWIKTVQHNIYLRVQEKGTDGKPLANPFFYHHGSGSASHLQDRYGNKWVLGNDPEDTTLVQTTAITYPTGLSKGMIAAFDQKDFNHVFVECGNKDNKTIGVARYQWVPNGAAILDTKFGDNGVSLTMGNWNGGNSESGVETDGTYLYAAIGNHYITEAEANVFVWETDGTFLQKFDISDYFSSVEASKVGGQMNGGPNTIYNRNGMLYLSCHCSCMKLVVDPIAGIQSEDNFIVYANGNGDYVSDHNYQSDAKLKWICNDYNVGPYTYTFNADANHFSVTPIYDEGAVSFALFAPDGTGIGNQAFAGETAALKRGQYLVDNGSAFDGFYSDRNEGGTGISPGVYYTAADSFKGIISKEVAVADAAPAAFAVAQNVPNPFNPATTISFTLAKAGKTTVEVFNAAGQKVDTILNASLNAGSHSVTWNAAKHSAGVYFYTVKNGDFSRTMKMTLLK